MYETPSNCQELLQESTVCHLDAARLTDSLRWPRFVGKPDGRVKVIPVDFQVDGIRARTPIFDLDTSVKRERVPMVREVGVIA